MKYQNLSSFEKHLSSAAPHNFCRSYLVQIADDQERGKALQLLQKYLVAPDSSLHRFNGAETDLRELFDALLSPSLFGGEAVALVDDCEKLAKKDAETLAEFLEKPAASGYLLLGARGKTPLSKTVEKSGVVLDLSEEKPWDREKRLAEVLQNRVMNRGKRLAPDAAPLLFERLGFDGALLEQEIDKLICYIGDRPTIERSDIFRISAASRTANLWQTAEEIVWEGGQALDPTTFHALVPALRTQLHLGLKIATLLEERVPPENWNLTKIWPRTLEKRKEQAAKKGALYFK